jgi:hypothetical protein
VYRPRRISVDTNVSSERAAGAPPAAAALPPPPFELRAWLASLRLEQYASALRDAGLSDRESLFTLTRASLATCGITQESHVQQLLAAADALPRAARTPRALLDDRERVRAFLSALELQQYSTNLLEAGFDSMAVVELLTVEDMVACGIDVPGHRRRLMKAVEDAARARRAKLSGSVGATPPRTSSVA